jgi:Acyl-CoA synthetase (NDP forming)
MPPRDIPAVVDILIKFSRLVEDNPEIREADLNPVIALEEGKGAYVVDARFILQI